MKRNTVLLFLLSLFLTLSCNQAIVQKTYADPTAWNTDRRVSYFYDHLKPYGEWFWHHNYGWSWYPYNVAIDWRPYTDGYWVYTDDGWTWESDLPWGWACFHYGRWFFDDTYGWCWYPDTVWAPSWCVWRTGGDWIGWAPLPPEAIWSLGTGLAFTDFDADHFIPRHAFCFVRRREFLDKDLRHRVRMSARNMTIFKETSLTVKNLTISNNKIVNKLPVHEELEKMLGHPIKRLKIAEADSPIHSGITENEVRFFRPERISTTISSKPSVSKEKVEEMTAQSSVVGPNISEGQGQQQAIPEQQLERQVPSDVIQRHNDEMRALQELQQNRSRALQEEHDQELRSPPEGIAPEQLRQQHQAEVNMYQEQVSREQRMLQNWHDSEKEMMTAPGAQPHLRFNIPVPQRGAEGGERYERRKR